MSTYCPNCRIEVETRYNAESQATYCSKCYIILEQNQMVSDVVFVEGGGGRKGVIGEIVKTRGRSDEFNWAGREVLISTVTETMRSFAEQVNVRDSDTLDFGIRVYKLALEKKIVRGRPRDITVAISLYIACRMQKRPVMLIDFSELLRRDVFLLGHAYYQTVKLLQLRLPLIDPALYLERFASQLDYGEKFYDVVRTAAKLAGRMNRDWMIQGRRPAGISAAALIISSRIHGFLRTNEDVMTVVRMSASTVQKRLDEFLKTDSAKLTPDQFEVKSEYLKEELDPPVFREKINFTIPAVKSEVKIEGADDVDENTAAMKDGEGSQNKNGENSEQEIIEINDDDVQAVNDLFDNEDIQALEDDFQEDETNPWIHYRFRLENTPDIEPWIFAEDEVAEDNIPSDDEEIQQIIVSDKEVEVRKMLWNMHFGNIEREVLKKRREKAMLEQGRVSKRRKTQKEEVNLPWDAESAEESTREMLQRISTAASRSELFDYDIDFTPKITEGGEESGKNLIIDFDFT